jgi:ATP-binding cassette subfamily F protein 3
VCSQPAQVEIERERLENRLGDPAVYGDDKALARTLDLQQQALDTIAALGGDTYVARARAMLRGPGLVETDYSKPIQASCGGQKKLVSLTRLLLAHPTLLLLDEPDNHLDLAGSGSARPSAHQNHSPGSTR